MPNVITFTQTIIRYLDVRLDPQGENCNSRIHCTANLTEKVREKMGWEELAESIDSAKLTGELHGVNAIFTPSEKELGQYQFEIAIQTVGNFEAVRIQDCENSSHVELRFVIKSPDENAALQGAAYLRRLGRCKGSIKVSYSKQLELGEEAEKDQEELVEA